MMRSVATTSWTLTVGILLFAIALAVSSCASFEIADAHGELASHSVFAACHSPGSLMASRISSPIVAALILLIAFAVLGTAFQRIEPEKLFRSYSRDNQLPVSLVSHLQRALREGILHSRAYIGAFVPSG